MSSNSTFNIEKLKGVEDYNQWKFLIRMILIHEDMEECITSETGSKDEKKNQKALGKICLSVSNTAIQHVRGAKTAYEAWANLQKAYEDKGLVRRLGLLRYLFKTNLNGTEGMEEYVSKIISIGQQLEDIDSKVEDEFLAIIMLSGLPTDPLIMALENSDMKLTCANVKQKLLQESQRRNDKLETDTATALVAKKVWKCFKCLRITSYKVYRKGQI